jgi:predicted secreted protein
MNWFTGILVYAMVWVVVLLTVLPFGVRPPDAPEEGHEPGAPERPLLLRKFLVTTILAAVIWAGIYVVIDQGWISFRDSVEPFRKPAS